MAVLGLVLIRACVLAGIGASRLGIPAKRPVVLRRLKIPGSLKFFGKILLFHIVFGVIMGVKITVSVAKLLSAVIPCSP